MTLPRVVVLADGDGPSDDGPALGNAAIRAFGVAAETVNVRGTGGPDIVIDPPDAILVGDLTALHSARAVGRLLSSLRPGVPHVIAARISGADGPDRVDAETLSEIKRSVLLGASLLVASVRDACRLAGCAPEDPDLDPGHVAMMLTTVGVNAVLLPGIEDAGAGRSDLVIGEAVADGAIRLDGARGDGPPSKSVCGVLAAAAAAGLAAGRDLEDAVRAAGAFARRVCGPDGTVDPAHFPGAAALENGA